MQPSENFGTRIIGCLIVLLLCQSCSCLDSTLQGNTSSSSTTTTTTTSPTVVTLTLTTQPELKLQMHHYVTVLPDPPMANNVSLKVHETSHKIRSNVSILGRRLTYGIVLRIFLVQLTPDGEITDLSTNVTLYMEKIPRLLVRWQDNLPEGN